MQRSDSDRLPSGFQTDLATAAGLRPTSAGEATAAVRGAIAIGAAVALGLSLGLGLGCGSVRGTGKPLLQEKSEPASGSEAEQPSRP